MKTNPFYALSASAMLLGCWLLSEALELQAGQRASLLLLMAVLQLYEGLLVLLGAFLVRTGRAPRDGRTVLGLETLFLVDATLLVTECVTADAAAGTAVAVAAVALAALKLAWVRRAAPGLLSRRAALLLGTQTALVLAVPVAAAHLAQARLLGSLALYAFWWATLALPLAQRVLRDDTRDEADAAPRAHAAWTWVPSAMALLHLWAVGYIHTIGFQPAFLAPFLLGLAVTAGREQVVRQVVLPALAVLVSLGQGEALGFHLFGAGGLGVSPLRVAALGVAASWAYLAWRDRARWLAILAVGGGAAFLLGSHGRSVATALGHLLDAALPGDGFGWGVLTVIAAYVLLGAGARRSLGRGAHGPRRGPQQTGGWPRWRWREAAAVAMVLSVFAASAIAVAFEASASGLPRQTGITGLAFLAATIAVVAAVRAHGRAAQEPADPPAQRLALLAAAVGALGALMALTPVLAFEHHPLHTERRVIGDVRTMMAEPRDERPRGAFDRHGYRFTPTIGPSGSFAWVAVPVAPGGSGIRSFCGDSAGNLCFTAGSEAPRIGPDGRCDLARCSVLQ